MTWGPLALSSSCPAVPYYQKPHSQLRVFTRQTSVVGSHTWSSGSGRWTGKITVFKLAGVTVAKLPFIWHWLRAPSTDSTQGAWTPCSLVPFSPLWWIVSLVVPELFWTLGSSFQSMSCWEGGPLFFGMSSLILGDKEFRTFAHVEAGSWAESSTASQCICRTWRLVERRGVGVVSEFHWQFFLLDSNDGVICSGLI